MNPNQIINIIIKMVMRKLINKGINAGVEKVARKGKSKDQMTAQDKQNTKTARDMTKRARQAMRVGRKIGKL